MSFFQFWSLDVFKPHSESRKMRANRPPMEIMTRGRGGGGGEPPPLNQAS